MTDITNTDDPFLTEMEKAVRSIINNRKASRADKLAAINAGTKLAAIRYKINGGDGDKGFFDK